MPDHKATGDTNCDCPKVPAGHPFVSNVQSITNQGIPPFVTGSNAEEIETNGDGLELSPGDKPLVDKYGKSVTVRSMLNMLRGIGKSCFLTDSKGVHLRKLFAYTS